MRSAIILLLTLLVVAAFEAAYYVYRYVKDRDRSRLERRLRALGHGERVSTTLLRPGRLARSEALDALLRRVPLLTRLEALLDQTSFRTTVAELLVYSAIASVGGLIAALAVGLGGAVAALLWLLAGSLPTFVVAVAADRRSHKISEQLPDALDMMSRSLRAGHALTTSFQVVASELPEPVNLEFARAYEAQNLGLSLERTILQMCERAPKNRDLRIFAVSVIVQKETGGNLAEILEKISETIRARYRFYGKLRSLTAEGRASGLVLGVLPLGMAGFLLTVNPKYLATLLTNNLGHTIIAYAALSWLFGIVWLHRMTKLEL